MLEPLDVNFNRGDYTGLVLKAMRWDYITPAEGYPRNFAKFFHGAQGRLQIVGEVPRAIAPYCVGRVSRLNIDSMFLNLGGPLLRPTFRLPDVPRPPRPAGFHWASGAPQIR